MTTPSWLALILVVAAPGASVAAPVVAPLAAAPASPRRGPLPALVSALVCAPPSPAIGPMPEGEAPALAATLTALQERGIALVDATAPGTADACEAVRASQNLADTMPDLVVAVSGIAGSSASNREPVRVSFRLPGRDLQISMLGRVFSGAFTARTLLVPAPPRDATTTDPLGGSRPPARAGDVQAELVVAGLARAIAYRKLSARDDSTDEQRAQAEEARTNAFELLARADTDWLAAEAPVTSAVLKQVRATLLIGGSCTADSPLELLRAAARLVPYSADARTLAAMARLKEAYDPTACPLAAEQELFESLELNPWSTDAADNLGLLYELTVDAQPKVQSAGDISADQATERLERVWKKEAPVPPRALEVAAAVAFSSAVDQSVADTAPAVRVEVGYGRDGTGWGVRLGIGAPWSRQTAFVVVDRPEQPWVSWTRFTLDLGPRYRLRLGRNYGEIAVAPVVAAVVAVGHGFHANYSTAGANFGGAGALRVGHRFGWFSLWSGVAVSHFISTTSLELVADNTLAKTKLPSTELSILGGVSVLLWQ